MEQQVEALKQNAELRAFNTVVELIRQREIVPGQRLFEPDLSKRLSMSRTPLRTALSRLVAEGILVKERGRKGYLLPALSSEDMRQIFYSRAAVEGAAAARLREALQVLRLAVIQDQRENTVSVPLLLSYRDGKGLQLGPPPLVLLHPTKEAADVRLILPHNDGDIALSPEKFIGQSFSLQF